jgi:hypothetical protein
VVFGREMILVLVALTCACAWPATSRHAPPTDPRASELVFLSRQGCAATARMRRNVDEALKSLGTTAQYQVVDLDTLAPSDVRRGYPTPTLFRIRHDVCTRAEFRPQQRSRSGSAR